MVSAWLMIRFRPHQPTCPHLSCLPLCIYAAAGTSNLRQTTVHANDEVLIAQFEFDSFTGYVEGLGSKMARRFSKRLADTVLVRVIYNETKSALEDRRLLQNISKDRRHAVSWPCEEDLG